MAAMRWRSITGGNQIQRHLLVDFVGRLGSVSDIAAVKATINVGEPAVYEYTVACDNNHVAKSDEGKSMQEVSQ